MEQDNRSVIDYYKYWKDEAIKADLDTKRHNFSILISNKLKDFNASTVIRNANAFLAKEVIIYGRKKWDRRGAIGTHNYTNFKYVKTEEELSDAIGDELVIGVDNINNAKRMETYNWPSVHFIVAFGQEDIGLPQELIDRCKDLVYISQYGSTRSLNVGCASAITMYDIVRKGINVISYK